MADQRQLWPLTIDWKGGFVFSTEYKTAIFPSRDRHEYRRAEREEPRFSFEYNASAHGSQAQGVMRTMQTLITEDLVLPHPMFYAKLMTPLIATTTSFTVDAVPAWLTVGRYAVVVYKDTRWLVEILSVSGTTIGIDVGPGQTFPVGSKLFLGVFCKVNPASRLTYLTNRVLTGKVNLDDIVGLNYLPDEGAPFATFRSKEVLMKKPNWATPIEVAVDAGMDVVDYEYGRRGYDAYLDFVPHINKAEYLARTLDEAFEFLQFFIRQRGRRGEFYMPTWTDDLPLAAGLTSGQATFRVTGAEFDDFSDNPAQRNVMFMMKDGSVLYRQVTGITVSGSESIFAVSGNWASTVPLSSIAYCCWLNTYRFAVDELSLELLTDSVAQFATSFQLLRDLDESL